MHKKRTRKQKIEKIELEKNDACIKMFLMEGGQL